MRAFLIFFILLFCNNSFAEEVFVNYLKPIEKIDHVIQKTKRRDPMQEPPSLVSKFKTKQNNLLEKIFDLKAILYNPKSKKAYINNELYMEGDNIEGYKVKSITEDTVILSRDKKEVVLKIE